MHPLRIPSKSFEFTLSKFSAAIFLTIVWYTIVLFSPYDTSEGQRTLLLFLDGGGEFEIVPLRVEKALDAQPEEVSCEW